MSKNQLAIVTGASSGIGEATARELASRGLHVLAGVRNEADAKRVSSKGIEGIILDITEPAHIQGLAQRVANDPTGRPLAALVNNAGVSLNAPIETLPIHEWRRHFEVNFFGHVAVTQALLPALIAAQGRVVNITSIGGKVAFPTYGAYAASKFALEGMSDVLRREMSRFGVAVIVIEPGTVNTQMWGKGLNNIQETAAELASEATEAQKARYTDLLDVMTKMATSNVDNNAGVAPSEVAAVIGKAIETRRPRTRYLVGRDARLLALMNSVLSDRAFDRVVARNLGLPKSTKPSKTSTAPASGSERYPVGR